MKKCPVCNFGPLEKSRCPRCQSALTLWLNYDRLGAEAYRAGLSALTRGDRSRAGELLLQAVVLAPDEVEHLAAYGRFLGQEGRYREAAFVLEKAYELAPTTELKAARDKAVALAAC